MSERLQGLKDHEQAACRIAERALGAVATAHDLPPRQGAVDAFLDYPDGRRAAFEVTQLATDGGASHLLDHLLSRDGFRWPLPGKWWWHVTIEDPKDLPRLRRVFDRIVFLCEAFDVRCPQHLFCRDLDEDVRWLTRESSVEMWGHPDVPAVDAHGGQARRALITRPSVAAFSDHSFSQLDTSLAEVFGIPRVQRHVEKLARTKADERHLFVIVGVYDLPFALFEALGFGDNLPVGVPALPEGVTHLWLAPVYGRRVLIATAGGWSETRDL